MGAAAAGMTRPELEAHIAAVYGVEAEHPWAAYPAHGVFRHGSNRKWFAVAMSIPREKLGLREAGSIDVLNVKCDPIVIGSFLGEPGIFPAYHMSKAHWLTIALDGSVESDKVKWLLEMSYDLTAPKRRRKTQKNVRRRSVPSPPKRKRTSF